jgi:RNA polymerase sigma-70 factor (ECF subfamily)
VIDAYDAAGDYDQWAMGGGEPNESSAAALEDLDTARLVARIQGGDRDAFALLYMRYFDRVYSYLRAIFGDEHEAENATQEVFIRVLESLPGYERRAGHPFRVWLFKIARNHALTQVRGLRRVELFEPAAIDRRHEQPILDEPHEPDALGWISDRELLMFVERLPLAQRQVLVLRYMVDLPDSEIALLLSCSTSDVRVLRSRALRFLRQRLAAVRHRQAGGVRGAPWRRRLREAPVLRSRRFALTP